MNEQRLEGRRIAIIAADMVEQVELVEPRRALTDAGAETDLISMKPGTIQGFDHFEPADEIPVDRTIDEADAADYDGLLIPGGVGNPDQMRVDERMVRFTRELPRRRGSRSRRSATARGCWSRPTSCAAAPSPRGRRSAPTSGTRAASWVDEEVVVDSGVVTSRKPDDIPAFNEKMIEEFANGARAEGREAVGSRPRGR